MAIQKLPAEVTQAITRYEKAVRAHERERGLPESAWRPPTVLTELREASVALRVALHRALGNQPDQSAISRQREPA